MTDSLYEQLKDDLGYLGLGPVRRVLRPPGRRGQGRENGATSSTWPGSSASRPTSTLNRKLAARLRFARFPFRRNLGRLRLRVPAERRPQADRRTWPRLRFIEENRPVLFLGPARLWQDPPGRRFGHHRGRGRLPGLLHHGRRHGQHLGAGPTRRHLRLQAARPSPPRACSSSTTSGCCRSNAAEPGPSSTWSTPAMSGATRPLITTNRGLPEWGEIFGDPVVAAAILDRLMHNAVVFNWTPRNG